MYNVILAEMLCKFSAMICPLANTKIVFRQDLTAKKIADLENAEAERVAEINAKLLAEKTGDTSKAAVDNSKRLDVKKQQKMLKQKMLKPKSSQKIMQKLL